MQNWIIGKQKHLFFLGILLIYLFAANPVYVHFFMKNGKPSGQNIALPAATKDVVFALNDLQPVRYEGQNLYELRGFAFQKARPEQVNKITVVLSNGSRNVVFATQPVQYPNMIQSYQGYTPAMDSAEFSMLVSNDGLAPGAYKIGILLEQVKGGGERVFVQTSATIKKTPNSIQYIPAP